MDALAAAVARGALQVAELEAGLAGRIVLVP